MENKEVAINHEFDYSNVLAIEPAISYLIEYCDNVHKNLVNAITQDEQKNEKLKSEYRYYDYKKSYFTGLTVTIKTTNYGRIECKDFDKFKSAVQAGNINNVEYLTIELNMSYKRGKEYETVEHENIFKISFHPYNIKFTRKSNHEDTEMDKIENNINAILNKFPIANSIFCSK